MTPTQRSVPPVSADRPVIHRRCAFRGAHVRWMAGAVFVIAGVTALSVVEVNWLWNGVRWKPALLGLTVARHLIELICICYAVCFTYATVRYVRVWRGAREEDGSNKLSAGKEAQVADAPTKAAPCAVIYLCCNDLEVDAVRGLSTLNYDGRLIHILHDDSTSPEENERVDRLVEQIAEETGVQWRIMRRSEKSGGKAGAVQYVLKQTADEHEFFLLLDNDSYVCDRDVLRKAMPTFADDRVAAVQFRNRALCESVGGRQTPIVSGQRPKVSEQQSDCRLPRFQQIVAGAVDVFDAFATGLFDVLWRPFVGHNAVLRTGSVMRAGGFTPGYFADDIDLTVRLNLRGERVVYRRDLEMQERHPSNYRSFTVRSKKWAHGCAQILRTHLLSVIGSDVLTVREKFGFLLFTGFYVTQVLMLLYMAIVFLVLPVMVGPTWNAAWWALIVGTIVPASIFLPVSAYLLTEGRSGRAMPFWKTLGACAATYGSTDLWTIAGLRSGFRREGARQATWVPTNSVLNGNRPIVDWSHFAIGAAVLLVPLWFQPELLVFPLTWLFAAKFLFVPAVAAHYVERDAAQAVAAGRSRAETWRRRASGWRELVRAKLVHGHSQPTALPEPASIRRGGRAPSFRATRFDGLLPLWRFSRVATVEVSMILVLLAVALFSFSAAAFAEEGAPAADADAAAEMPNNVRIEIRGREILIDGVPTILRGIHYGPWRPGTGPGRGFDYPSPGELRSDLRMIRSLNANTILVYDPPARLLDLAEQEGLNVVYVFNIEWWRVADEDEREAVLNEIAERVELLSSSSAVIAWMLGNETPGWIIDELSPEGVRDYFTSLRRAIRTIDPHRPVTHGNWPLSRSFDLDQSMDIVSYNVYPFYPTEVAVSGYGAFIRDFIMPRVGDRPLLITEFGINTLEASPEQQAAILRRCWRELLDAGAQGGVVFAFADEWWKNYDNPIRPPDYWRRAEAPDDHLSHDQDPEEHYGIVNAYREPKPAFHAVREIFAEEYSRPAESALPGITARQVLIGIGTAAVLGMIVLAFWLRIKAAEM